MRWIPVALEVEPPGKLKDARIRSTRGVSKGPAILTQRKTCEVGMIQNIEALEPKLELQLVAYGEAATDRHIYGVLMRLSERVPANIAEGSDCVR